MKTRLGFVSNSSSSSYIIITTKESYNKVIKSLSEIERLATEAVFKFSKEKVFGKDKLVEHTTVSSEDLFYDCEQIGEDDWDEAYNGIDKFFQLISREPDSYCKNFS